MVKDLHKTTRHTITITTRRVIIIRSEAYGDMTCEEFLSHEKLFPFNYAFIQVQHISSICIVNEE